MAISIVTYKVLHAALAAKALPCASSILEFGEAEWYGDVPLPLFLDDIRKLVQDANKRTALEKEMESIIERVARVPTEMQEKFTWRLAKIFYKVFFDCNETIAIDLNGTKASLRLDLNLPIDLGRQFPVTINNGTAEHIFNFAQFFSTMHQHTAPGGMMIHEGPLINGWIDHGFVNFQPTLFFDIAAANHYEIESFYVAQIEPLLIHGLDSREEILEMAKQGTIPQNAIFFVILRKNVVSSNFKIPMQGIYAERISARAKSDWITLR